MRTLKDFLDLPKVQKVIENIKRNGDLAQKFNNIPGKQRIVCLETAVDWCEQFNGDGEGEKFKVVSESVIEKAIEIFEAT